MNREQSDRLDQKLREFSVWHKQIIDPLVFRVAFDQEG